MNEWQLTRQLLFALQQRVWPDAPAEHVFAAVRATPLEQALRGPDLQTTLALVEPTLARAHDERPDVLEEVHWNVTVAVPATTDQMGQAAVIGAGAAPPPRERGLLRLEREARAAIADVGLGLLRLGDTAPFKVDTAGPSLVVSRAFEVVARRISADPYYHPPRRFRAIPGAAGALSLQWELPPPRWDRFGLVLRRASGTTPPGTPSSGASVPLPAPLDTATSDTPGAGTWSYALFAGYSESGRPRAERYSTPAVITASV